MLLWGQSPLSPGIPHSSGDLGLATRPCRAASGGQRLCLQQYENHQLLKDKIIFLSLLCLSKIFEDCSKCRFMSLECIDSLPLRTKSSSSSTKLNAMVSGQIHAWHCCSYYFWRRKYLACFVVFIASVCLLTCLLWFFFFCEVVGGIAKDGFKIDARKWWRCNGFRGKQCFGSNCQTVHPKITSTD